MFYALYQIQRVSHHDLVSMGQLSAPSRFHHAIYPYFTILYSHLCLHSILSQIGQFQELPQANRFFGDSYAVYC